jgi:hypothetical protein
MSTSGYEFSNDQNQLIGDLAKKINFVGLMAVVLSLHQMYSLLYTLLLLVLLAGLVSLGLTLYEHLAA